MANRAVKKKTTPRSWHYNGVSGHISCDPNIVPNKDDEFERATRWAGIILFFMLVFLGIWAVIFGW